jgi:hypothetical protein
MVVAGLHLGLHTNVMQSSNDGQTNTARSDHRHAGTGLDANSANAVDGDGQWFDECGCPRCRSGRHRKNTIRIHQHTVGESAMKNSAEEASHGFWADVRTAGRAHATRAAHASWSHRNQSSVGEPATEFVTHSDRTRSHLQHVDIAATDPSDFNRHQNAISLWLVHVGHVNA